MNSIFSNTGISLDQFLTEYWQKKPLVIRQALPNFQCPINANELAGLACEENVESRIILETEKGQPWQCHQGPFNESLFSSLPETHWTLLIQGLNNWVPGISDILNEFRFIPGWHLDDIMASYAPDQGSVGPHYDFYDVFLLQAQGQRRWKVGPMCNQASERLEGTPLRILKHFETEKEFLLEPGDILYLPPLLAHYGIAKGECITLSIGFRTPSETELFSSFADYLCDNPPLEKHMPAAHLPKQTYSGELTAATLKEAKKALQNIIEDEDRLTDWFGKYCTAPKNIDTLFNLEEAETFDIDNLEKDLESSTYIRWNEGSRFVFNQSNTHITLFCDGQAFDLPHSALHFAQQLCAKSVHPTATILPLISSEHTKVALIELLNKQHLYLE